MQTIITAAPPTIQTAAEPVLRVVPTEQPSPLVSDLADALELLLAYRGRPLPRFVSEDGIRALVEQARR